MTSNSKLKKRIVTSYKNLTPKLLDEVKNQYPSGYQEKLIRVDKSPTDFFYAFMLEMEEISYLIKVDVKVDAGAVEEEEDKDFYDDDEIKGAEEIAEPSDDADSSDE